MKSLVFFLLLCFPAWPDIKTAEGYFLKWQFKRAKSAYLEELKKTNNPEILFPLAICFQKEGLLSSFRNIKTDDEELRDGLFFYYNGDYKRAFDSFRKAEIPYSYLGMGMCKKAMGDFNKAEELFLKARETPLAYQGLLDLYLLLGKEKSFSNILSEGINKTKDNELLFRFAKELNNKNDFSKALNILKICEKNEPENILIKEEILKTLMCLGKEEEEIFSHLKVSEGERIYLEGCFCAFTQSYLRAFRQFNACSEKQPDFFLAKIRALWMAKEIGWKKRVDKLYQEISQNVPGDGLCNVYLAEVYTKMGSYTEGFKYVRNALKKEPNLEVAHFALGNLYYLKNDFIKAIFSYKKGLNLSNSKRYFWVYLEDAFVQKFLPLFIAGYFIIWLITLLILLAIHYTGLFLIREYKALKRYLLKKKYVFYLYFPASIILSLSLILGERYIKYVPLELLAKSFFFFLYFHLGILFILILITLLSFFIRWSRFKIYTSFILLDISLDIGIIVLISSLIPFFADYPEVFSIVSVIVVVLFRRFRLLGVVILGIFFYLLFSIKVLSGYKKVSKGELTKGDSIFNKCLSSIRFIRWLEPTYSDMASSCILGRVFILIKKNEFEKIAAQWIPLLKSLEEWWPLNTRAKFIYDWSIILSLILKEEKEKAKESLKAIASIPEYKKRGGISFLFEMLGEEAPQEKKKPEKYLSFIVNYLKNEAHKGR